MENLIQIAEEQIDKLKKIQEECNDPYTTMAISPQIKDLCNTIIECKKIKIENQRLINQDEKLNKVQDQLLGNLKRLSKQAVVENENLKK